MQIGLFVLFGRDYNSMIFNSNQEQEVDKAAQCANDWMIAKVKCLNKNSREGGLSLLEWKRTRLCEPALTFRWHSICSPV